MYAIESNMFEHMSYFQLRLSTMKVIDAPDLLIINSELPSDTFNFVCRAKFQESDVDSRIKSAIAPSASPKGIACLFPIATTAYGMVDKSQFATR
ncbi:hypothetical protein NIES4073_50840 [Kalymmatonema gypsitolerans NIES-4073]|nr:hypothetical protein NIES4073_50840 [Scytonema sp. NIES-4073]